MEEIADLLSELIKTLQSANNGRRMKLGSSKNTHHLLLHG